MNQLFALGKTLLTDVAMTSRAFSVLHISHLCIIIFVFLVKDARAINTFDRRRTRISMNKYYTKKTQSRKRFFNVNFCNLNDISMLFSLTRFIRRANTSRNCNFPSISMRKFLLTLRKAKIHCHDPNYKREKKFFQLNCLLFLPIFMGLVCLN